MSPPIQSALINARTVAHYLDQPQVINRVHQFVDKQGLYGAVAAKFLYDLSVAKPDEYKKVALQDAMVLTPTLLATKWGLKYLIEPAEAPPTMASIIQANPKTFGKNPYPTLSGLFSRKDTLAKQIHHQCTNHHHHHPVGPARGAYSFREMQRIVSTVTRQGGKKANLHLGKLFPMPAPHDHSINMGHMVHRLFKGKGPLTSRLPKVSDFKGLWGNHVIRFFTIGGVIVGAGLVGGILHDVVTQNKEKHAQVNKIKEAIFQYIANIALCAVGAGVGIKLADMLKLSELAKKQPQRSLLYRGANFSLVMGGLAIGVVGGGSVANWVGRQIVNPFFEWMEKRQSGYTLIQALKDAKSENDRKVEFMDAVLHLDDLPTALALSGVQILLPFIPLFFAVSGYRAGSGYRNVHHEKPSSPKASPPSALLSDSSLRIPGSSFMSTAGY